MTAQDFLNTYQGQSLLYNKSNPVLTGECVQSVCFYVANNGFPVIWGDAFYWWTSGLFPDRYQRIVNTPEAVPQPGDIIIWGTTLPGSGGLGHIAIVLYANMNSFVSVDQNWGGRYVHPVTHNYSYVVGWLRFRTAQPAPQGGSDEMINTKEEGQVLYHMLRPNGGATGSELDATVGKRSFAQFLRDAEPEIGQRDANLRAQAETLENSSKLINAQNQTITELTQKLHDSEASAQDKQKALAEAMKKLADTNASLATAHDQLKDLQDTINPATPIAAQTTNAFAKILAWFMGLKK